MTSLGRHGIGMALLFGVVSCVGPGSETPVPSLAGGIQVNEPDSEAWTRRLRAVGLDTVQVTVYARQLAWDSAELLVPDSAPTVVDEIRAAKQTGLRVVLVLRVALEHALAENRHFWHGTIWPPDDGVDEWFENYGRFARWAAALSQAEGVDLLAIGSELNSLTSTIDLRRLPPLYEYFLDPERTGAVRRRLVACADRVPAEALEPDLEFVDGSRYDSLEQYLVAQEEADRRWTRHVTGATDGRTVDIAALNARRQVYERHWRSLIAELRTIYDGPLSYAANFDQVEDVGFWDALDAVGVNAYFPLSRWGQRDAVLDEALASSWEDIGGRLGALADRNGGPGRVLPVLLFELGWTRKAGSTVRPFSYDRVEALESVGRTDDGSTRLTCVHWATQPDDPLERVKALAALNRVVGQGAFPTLRGFMLWKLSTQPSHRAIEPFVVLLPDEEGSTDDADRQFLAIAAELAGRLRYAATLAR